MANASVLTRWPVRRIEFPTVERPSIAGAEFSAVGGRTKADASLAQW